MGINGQWPDSKIKEQVNRILSSPAFKSSRILSRFLDFIIDETLSGKQLELKEYIIGINVLSRSSDFNPQLDSIVRIHAGRLRRALKEYYYELGKKDPIFIEIPKGSYIPFFQEQQEQQQDYPLPRTKPTVAVLPFRNISKDPSRDFFADGLSEQLSIELSWFHDLSVISYYSSRHVAGITTDLKETSVLTGAKYLLMGSIQNDDTHLYIRVQLISAENGAQLWAKSFERNNTASGLFEIQNEIVRSILTAIGGYYGAIFRDVLKAPHNNSRNSIETYDAIFWYYHFQKVWTGDVFKKTIQALQAAVKADPDYALAWAMLGELYLDNKVLEYKTVENPIEEGIKCAQKAVSIDPNCQHGYQALAWGSLFLHNREECLKAVEQCIAINPNASGIVGGMGFVLTCAGEFERGYKLMNESMQQNPYCPWWFYGGFVFYFLYHKDYPQAMHWVEKIDRVDVLWDPLLKACLYAHLNHMEEAEKNLKLLIRLIPDAYSQVEVIIGAFLLSPELINEIMGGLKKAGLKGHAISVSH